MLPIKGQAFVLLFFLYKELYRTRICRYELTSILNEEPVKSRNLRISGRHSESLHAMLLLPCLWQMFYWN